MIKKLCIAFFLVILGIPGGRSEGIDSTFFMLKEDSILRNLTDLNNEKYDKGKLVCNENIKKHLSDLLVVPGSFDYGFDTLKHIGKIVSEDGLLRIYTWNVPFASGTHLYSGFIQYKIDRDSIILIQLTDRSKNMKDIENLKLSPSNWFGALYYQIVQVKHKRKVYYVLLGFDINDLFTHKKVIDVLYFDDYEQPVFGFPFFKDDSKIKHRVLFEYSARVMMSLKYDEKLDMIVFDHLSPFDSRYKDNYQFYGPDFSYDGFEFHKDHWILRKNVDARNYP